jgi:hypothetical protein
MQMHGAICLLHLLLCAGDGRVQGMGGAVYVLLHVTPEFACAVQLILQHIVVPQV